MTKGKRDLDRYIRGALNQGHSYEWIRENLIKAGYSQIITDGILLDFRHRLNFFQILTLLVLFSALVTGIFFIGSSIHAMVSLPYARSFSDPLDIQATGSSRFTWAPFAQGTFSSFSISGRFEGEGYARIFLISNESSYLLMDSRSDAGDRKKRENGYDFFSVCEETCAVSLRGKIYEISIEASGATVELSQIHYSLLLPDGIREVPRFLMIPDQEVAPGEMLQINLSNYFRSTRRVSFGYLIEDGLAEVNVADEVISIRPFAEGTMPVYFTAVLSDNSYMSNLVNIATRKQRTTPLITGNAAGAFQKEKHAVSIWPAILSFVVVILSAAILRQSLPLNNASLLASFEREASVFEKKPSKKGYLALEKIYRKALAANVGEKNHLYNRMCTYHSMLGKNRW